MRQVLARWGSTFIGWSFAITAVTGVLLFYRIHTPPNETLHIWIGFLMIAAFVPHVARNWRAFLAYFRKPPAYIALAITILISAVFAYPEMTGAREQGGGPPGMRSMAAISQALAGAPLTALAPIAHTDTAGVMAKLSALGAPTTDPNATVNQLASGAGMNANDLLAGLLGQQRQRPQ